MQSGDVDHSFKISTVGSETAVRDVIVNLRQQLAGYGIDRETCATVELAMAEALNNIVEHAYTADAPGTISVSARIGAAQVSFTLCDRGKALPGLTLPEGDLPDHAVATEDLPEGGFGWFLIRTLSAGVRYARHDGENRLTLEFARADQSSERQTRS